MLRVFFLNLRPIIALIHSLRDAGINNWINLTRIVAFWAQSSGKSLVLESIIGLSFLPSGYGGCTKRPLEIRLVYKLNAFKLYGVFEDSSKKFFDFSKIRERIKN